MLKSFFSFILFGCLAYGQASSSSTIEARRARLAAHAGIQGLSAGGVSLRERLKTSKTGSVVDVVRSDVMMLSRPSATTFDEWLASKKCDTDFVVHGVINRALSGLTADEKAVFTEFEFDLKDTLYVKEGHQPTSPVVIIKPGGAIKLPEGLAVTIFDKYSDLHLGQEYILFLRAAKVVADAYFLNESAGLAF